MTTHRHAGRVSSGSEGSGRVTAVLGPTNTGKTHLAVERMLGHANGVIGFPLRLLARENYDRIVQAKGRLQVALVTGEEKIVPPTARYFVCTVEAMPMDRAFDFLAVDEIQLAADPDRGHVFTDRLLRARGIEETLFLGSETIRPLIARLLPRADFIARPRFSKLTHVGPRKLTRLPRRSAVVAFSANDVYHLAEMIRRQRGGTAVVLGALSPRTRNAQVAMFQAGEVDYLVATDAIGMGLNMDIDHVAFARLHKFDGVRKRRLSATEIAQIAGRAGRHMADGSFGTLSGGLEEGRFEIDPEIVERVENHDFDALDHLMWRNAVLDFDSTEALLASLSRRSESPVLRRAPEAEDHLSLAQLAHDPEIASRARGHDRVRLLWQVCQIPDFRKTLSDQHVQLLKRVYRQLVDRDGSLDTDWVAGQIARLDRTTGDIDSLVTRLAYIRTWTFIAHRGDWLADARAWQERTRKIEDTLSDALHNRLTQRFVDRRAAVLSQGLSRGDLVGGVDPDGTVTVEGAFVGTLDGFRFAVDEQATAEDGKAILSVARRVLRSEIASRVAQLERAPDGEIALDRAGRLAWREVPVAQLTPGPDFYRPSIKVDASEFLSAGQRDRVAQRLQRWWSAYREAHLAPLLTLRDPSLKGVARGIAFQLYEAMGWLPRQRLAPLLKELKPREAKALSQHGVRLGAAFVFVPQALKPLPRRLIHLLWELRRPPPSAQGGGAVEAPKAGAVSLQVTGEAAQDLHRALGFVVIGERAIRVDRLDRLAAACFQRHRQGPFAASPDLAAMVGVRQDELPGLLEVLGYRPRGGAGEEAAAVLYDARAATAGPRRRAKRSAAAPVDDSHPFAELKRLIRR